MQISNANFPSRTLVSSVPLLRKAISRMLGSPRPCADLSALVVDRSAYNSSFKTFSTCSMNSPLCTSHRTMTVFSSACATASMALSSALPNRAQRLVSASGSDTGTEAEISGMIPGYHTASALAIKTAFTISFSQIRRASCKAGDVESASR